MKISGMARPEPLKGPCGIPVEKKRHSQQFETSHILQNRKQFWENIPVHS